MMWSPIVVTPPVVVAGIGGVFSRRWAKRYLPIAAFIYTANGLLGEYYLLGLGSYVRTFAVHWLTLTIYLVLYASVWRGLAEGVALFAACAAPANAAGARRAVEIACQVAYYGGVPVLLLLRFLP